MIKTHRHLWVEVMRVEQLRPSLYVDILNVERDNRVDICYRSTEV
jgi:hypothetical protein